MSYYRDDREAAHRRIEALEAKLLERDAELAAQGADLSARDEEIARLREEVEQARGLFPRRGIVSVTTVWAARSVGVALLMCSAMGGFGFFMASPRPAPDPSAFADERRQILVDQKEQATLPQAPAETAAPAAAPIQWDDPSRALEEHALKRSLEAKIEQGNATRTDLKLLQAICGHLADRPCRDRAAARLAAQSVH